MAREASSMAREASSIAREASSIAREVSGRGLPRQRLSIGSKTWCSALEGRALYYLLFPTSLFKKGRRTRLSGVVTGVRAVSLGLAGPDSVCFME